MNESLNNHFKLQMEELRKLAETFVKSRQMWWEGNFPTVYMDERQKESAIEWMVMEGNRCLYRHNFGSYIDTMLHTLDNFEWLRFGNFPRRCQFKQRYLPKGDHKDWSEYPYIEPPVKLIAKKFRARKDYTPLQPDEFDPVKEVG